MGISKADRLGKDARTGEWIDKSNHTKDEQKSDYAIGYKQGKFDAEMDRLYPPKDEHSDVRGMKEFYSTDAIPEEMKQALSFMRQWLNEDRKATPMVTARDLWHWLEKDYTKTQEQHMQEMQQLVEESKKYERQRIISLAGGEPYIYVPNITDPNAST